MNHDVPAAVWALFAALMKDESVMALNAALVYVYSTCKSPILTPRFALSIRKADSGGSYMLANGSNAFFRYVTDMPSTGSRFYLRSVYRSDDDSAEYIKLSIADRVAASGVASGSASDSLGVRMNIRLDDAGLARMDVDELLSWAEIEKGLWEDLDAVKRVAQHRTVEYCVAKFLEQPTVLAWDLANLEELSGSHESALAAILKGEFPKEPTTAQMRWSSLVGRPSACLPRPLEPPSPLPRCCFPDLRGRTRQGACAPGTERAQSARGSARSRFPRIRAHEAQPRQPRLRRVAPRCHRPPEVYAAANFACAESSLLCRTQHFLACAVPFLRLLLFFFFVVPRRKGFCFISGAPRIRTEGRA